MLRSSYLVATFAVAAVATAQTQNHLVGLTRNLANLRHADHVNCNVLGQCSPAGFPSAAGMPAIAGGTAWDPIRSGAWISNGQFLACVDDGCNYLCTPFALPGMGGGTVIVGLEVVESSNQLWIIDSGNTLRVMSLACPPQPLASCQVVFLDPTFTTTGLAVDELSGYVFYARTDLATGANFIAYADLATPCAIQAALGVAPCAGGPSMFTGLACDATQRRLYATDGPRTVSMGYVTIDAGLGLTAINCCPPVAGADPMIGLAVRPGRAVAAGLTCANGACPNCAMTHGLNGDSVLGNSQFGLHLGSAPVGSFAWCLIGAGPCTAPGVAFPQLCGPIYTTPVLGTLGLSIVTGGAGCAGSADFAMGLPAVIGLAGVVLSSQCVVLCASPAGFGTSLSSCLSFELQGI